MTESERLLREAMKRLLSGKALHTDGALTKNNLYREATVSRATMNRYQALLDEWNTEVAKALEEDPSAKKPLTEERILRRKLRNRAKEVRALKSSLDGAASLIALLAEENRYLRGRLIRSGNGELIALDEARGRMTDAD